MREGEWIVEPPGSNYIPESQDCKSFLNWSLNERPELQSLKKTTVFFSVWLIGCLLEEDRLKASYALGVP